MEIWKQIKGMPDGYFASNLGNVKSSDRIVNSRPNCTNGRIARGKIYTKSLDEDGYELVCMKGVCKGGSRRVHRLVCAAFLTEYSELLQVNHKNGVKNDNRIENLEMVTAKENVNHRFNELGHKRPDCSHKPHLSTSKKISFKVDGKMVTFDSISDAQRTTGRSRQFLKKHGNLPRMAGGATVA